MRKIIADLQHIVDLYYLYFSPLITEHERDIWFATGIQFVEVLQATFVSQNVSLSCDPEFLQLFSRRGLCARGTPW